MKESFRRKTYRTRKTDNFYQIKIKVLGSTIGNIRCQFFPVEQIHQ